MQHPTTRTPDGVQLGRFSRRRLERLLNALGMEIRIQVGPKPAGKKRAASAWRG
jgi:hypothetical protein